MMPTRLIRHSQEAPWVKFCGVCQVDQARRLASLGPGAIGFNFYPLSPRFVEMAAARAIREQLPPEILSVGVFVNASSDEIADTLRSANLAAIQLHGDEPPEQIADLRAALSEVPIIRAWRVGRDGLGELADYLAACSVWPDAVLIDAAGSGQYGGTGTRAPWHLLGDYRRDWPPLVLAGGLHSGNVAEAIAAVGPFGVDVASGIESAPGVKDPQRAEAFLAAARGEVKGES